jgi:hypothetical protein
MKEKIAAAIIPGAASGKVIRRAMVRRPAPMLAAASSRRSSMPRRVAMRISTAIGAASTVWPRAMAIGLPSIAAGSKSRNRPSAVTIWGMTSGPRTRAKTAERSGSSLRTNAVAAVTPMISENTVLMAAIRALRESAAGHLLPSANSALYQFSVQVSGGNAAKALSLKEVTRMTTIGSAKNSRITVATAVRTIRPVRVLRSSIMRRSSSYGWRPAS